MRLRCCTCEDGQNPSTAHMVDMTTSTPSSSRRQNTTALCFKRTGSREWREGPELPGPAFVGVSVDAAADPVVSRRAFLSRRRAYRVGSELKIHSLARTSSSTGWEYDIVRYVVLEKFHVHYANAVLLHCRHCVIVSAGGSVALQLRLTSDDWNGIYLAGPFWVTWPTNPGLFSYGLGMMSSGLCQLC
jgi:hypothetical protein